MNTKKIAGEKAAEFIENGMTVGLGTGSTVYYTIMKLAERVRKDGLKIRCVSTSSKTTKLGEQLGLEIFSLNDVDYIDVTIDGADEVDKNFNGIKGGGGALLYEKLVAFASKKVIWVIDNSKKVNKLGKFPLPVEVVPYAYTHLFNFFMESGFNPVLREIDEEIFKTDGGHYIIDLHMGVIDNPYEFSLKLKDIPGVVDIGMFLDMTDVLIVGNEDGAIVKLKNKE
ncbi:ribose-5-phosphate isomerase RpiA [Oceanirhabdus seepicola]|uniref:Ribose-5-phosphate isomerase A n=1 Tax=Oceanirhabdus seepicola TaxID=2828781 RepID=A0A9J6P3Z4_9CLOT|nr:ribose-5-phosphate isomerase RpiA [Oceanirhabdus seepicola]MCM1991498.1 ribose-5-phosphate isomerase RpiA [Oceanirhabdus seepicola]